MSDPNLPPGSDVPEAAPAPGLDETLRQVGAAGKATLGSAAGTARALRKLVVADLALARSALGFALIWISAAIVFGASAWLLMTSALIVLLERLGLSWLQAFSFVALANLVITGLAAWRGSYYFDQARMNATRRQLKRLGLLDDNEDDEAPAPAAPEQAP